MTCIHPQHAPPLGSPQLYDLNLGLSDFQSTDFIARLTSNVPPPPPPCPASTLWSTPTTTSTLIPVSLQRPRHGDPL
ncbi:Membrane-associated phosphatidylinositol transfer protein 3 [Dissostichus eleginoides]|uniref:Membrane-associated phosphatidylinositol transfer protein 3 n=1 Tax=Dissostichus eleginoides TaxID=100907 RepID=A0AAD9CDA7_DISEL|nr:Membrane-associated phosphatidylinositol transfer protein 3 [Dissostichus eleginoides]